MFLISKLQIPIHFLLSFLVQHENEMLVHWLAVSNMRPQQKLLFSFYVKNSLNLKEETSKADNVVDKPGTLFFWDEKIC